MPLLALGVDPGMEYFGYSLVGVHPSSLTVVDMGLIRTAKTDKMQHVYAAEDSMRRTREIAAGLLDLLTAHVDDLKIICAEISSFSQNSITAAKIAMAWGVVAAVAEMWNLPIVQMVPQTIKKAVCGLATADKQQVQQALDVKFREELGAKFLTPKKLAKGKWEHPYDALAAVVALQHSQTFQAVRGTRAV